MKSTYKKNHVFLLAFLYLICSTQRIYAFNEHIYTSSNALSSSLFCDFIQDSEGYFWIATEYGLNRYDGYSFIPYYYDKTDPNSIQNNFIISLFEDSKKNLWLGGVANIQIYNKKENNFRRISIRNFDEELNTSIHCFLERQNGDIWIGTGGNGILSTNLRQFNDTVEVNQVINDRLKAYRVSSLYEDKDYNVWICAENKGLYMYTKSEDFIEILDPEGKRLNNVASITDNSSGDVFIGTLTDGLFRYDKYSRKTTRLSFSLSIKKLFYLEEYNALLIGTEGDGLKYYDYIYNTTTDANLKLDLSPKLNDKKIHGITCDRSGNLWFGIYQYGVVSVPNIRKNFNYIGHQSIKHNLIGSACVKSIELGSQRKMYVGTDGQGLYEIDLNSMTSRHWKGSTSGNLFPISIMHVLHDSKERLWLSSYHQGLFLLNKNRTHCEKINLCNQATQRISCVLEKNDGNFIIATYGSGVYHYDEKNKTSKHIPIINNEWVNTLYQDRQNNIWIGTAQSLYILKMQHDVIDIKRLDEFNGFNICSVFQDINDEIWIGSRNGLYRYTEDGSIPLDKDFPELNTPIRGIESDQNNNLWFSTLYGLYQYDIQQKKIKAFFFDDGLQSNEFSEACCFEPSSKQLFFGGPDGISFFNANEIENDTQPLNVSLSCATINNNISELNISESDIIELEPYEKSLTLEFSTLELTRGKVTQYFYRIIEVDDQWKSLHLGNNRLEIVNTPVGEYTFEVKAQQGQRTSPIKSYKIWFKPAWYQTIYFKLSLLAIILQILSSAVFYIYTYIKKLKEVEILRGKEHISESKFKFFINISHEIKTPLSLIIAPLEQLLLHCKDDEQHKIYEMMYRNAQKILTMVRQLFDIQKIDQGKMKLNIKTCSLYDNINRNIQLLQYSFDQKNQKVSFIHDSNKMYVDVDEYYFDTIISNLLSNANKYTPVDGIIEIMIQKADNDNFNLIIQDNGPGFAQNHNELIFERFYLNTDANPIGSTGIGLNLTRSLVELHKGKITAENRTDVSGARFTVSMAYSDIDNTNTPHNIELPKELVTPITETKVLDDKHEQVDNKCLLIVDDEVEIRSFLRQIFERNYHIIEAENGEEAFRLALTCKPKLIITDVMMPVMDGLQLTRKIREHTQTRPIPLVMLTAKAKVEDQLSGLQHGADAFIAKPFNVEILKNTVDNLINRINYVAKETFVESEHTTMNVDKTMLSSKDEFLLLLNKTISQNMQNPNFNGNMLADSLCMSRMQLHRKMKEYTTFTPSEYLKSIRMKEAYELISHQSQTDSHINIGEIAQQVGYNNTSHFSISFKKHFGIPPSELKKDLQRLHKD